MTSVQLQTSKRSLKWLVATLIQVLDKCQLLEAVQEKEHGLDSLGRRPCFLCNFVLQFFESLTNCAVVSAPLSN
jgi:hypothetical protein